MPDFVPLYMHVCFCVRAYSTCPRVALIKLLPSQSLPADFSALMFQHAHRALHMETYSNTSQHTRTQTRIIDTVTFTVGELVSMATVMVACQGVKTINGQDLDKWMEGIKVSGRNDREKIRGNRIAKKKA